jgi:hypothetical protein
MSRYASARRTVVDPIGIDRLHGGSSRPARWWRLLTVDAEGRVRSR